jgi:uncharacterized hydantoinase/oxoprolinase family protein
MATTETLIGWDIGGAHVKAALLRNGRLEAVRQWPCALWQGLHLLDAVLDDALAGWPQAGPVSHAVTMTGEMVDLFDSREDGVIRLVRHLARRLGPGLRLFGSTGEWLASGEAADRWQELASANWAATARMVAGRLHGQTESRTESRTEDRTDGHTAGRIAGAMLVDIGSTTTDLVPLAGGRVLTVGSSDAQRLQTGELLYQGAIRTPLCALAGKIEFRGARYNVMNEWFATTADVYRLTGELDPAHDQHPAADGGDKDVHGSCRRIARMIGHDAGDAALEDWQAFARQWRRHQLERLQAELQRVESAPARACARSPIGPAAGSMPLVGAGCGSFLVRALAQSLQRDYIAFDALIDAPPALRGWAGVCAPAVAVAVLHHQASASLR